LSLLGVTDPSRLLSGAKILYAISRGVRPSDGSVKLTLPMTLPASFTSFAVVRSTQPDRDASLPPSVHSEDAVPPHREEGELSAFTAAISCH
jgi:hypothetical protein